MIDETIIQAIATKNYDLVVSSVVNKIKETDITYAEASLLRMALLSKEASVRATVYPQLDALIAIAKTNITKFHLAVSMAECSCRSQPQIKSKETLALLINSYNALEKGQIPDVHSFLLHYYTGVLLIPDMFDLPVIGLENCDHLFKYIEAYKELGRAIDLDTQSRLDMWHLSTLAHVVRQNIVLSIISSGFLAGMDPALPYLASLEPTRINFRQIMANEDLRYKDYRRQYDKIRPKNTKILVPGSAIGR